MFKDYYIEFYTDYEDEMIVERKFVILIIYDIVKNSKRVKLSKYLDGFGRRVQKSSYEAILSEKLFRKLKKGISKFASEEDSIRIYKISGTSEIECYGMKQDLEEVEIIIV